MWPSWWVGEEGVNHIHLKLVLCYSYTIHANKLYMNFWIFKIILLVMHFIFFKLLSEVDIIAI